MSDMSPAITENNTSEYEIHKLSAEASELGIPPGLIPMQLTTDMGNKQPFILTHRGNTAFYYRQGNGCLMLTVFKD